MQFQSNSIQSVWGGRIGFLFALDRGALQYQCHGPFFGLQVVRMACEPRQFGLHGVFYDAGPTLSFLQGLHEPIGSNGNLQVNAVKLKRWEFCFFFCSDHIQGWRFLPSEGKKQTLPLLQLKLKIDTPKSHILKELLFPNHEFWYPCWFSHHLWYLCEISRVYLLENPNVYLS